MSRALRLECWQHLHLWWPRGDWTPRPLCLAPGSTDSTHLRLLQVLPWVLNTHWGQGELCKEGSISEKSVSSVTQSCLTLCDPMDCSMPGFPVHHQLPEFTQTHAHWVSDAIQPSHPLSSPSPLAFNLFPSIRVFSNESALRIRWLKYWGLSFSEKYVNLKLYPEPSNCLFIPLLKLSGMVVFYWCVRYCARGSICIISLNPHNGPMREVLFSHFTLEETGA